MPVLALIVAFGFGVYELENFITDENAKQIHIWGQFITGSWPREWNETIIRNSGEFAFWITLRFVLVIGTVVSVLRTLQAALIRERRETMRLRDYLSARDRLIKDQILNDYPLEQRVEAGKKLDKHFEKGSQIMEEKLLPQVFGEEQANEMRKAAEEAINKRLTH